MYNNYFGLQDSPFSIAPNPHYLYLSQRHREALAHLMYGIKSDGGFILLTGEVGTGKTTVCRCLLAQIPGDVDIALILNPKMTALEMLATVCDELGIDYPASPSIKSLVDNLNKFLLRSHQQGRKTILIIDEAQNLSIDVLEQLRLLTNLETNQRKLLQIILLGQPELLSLLDCQELRQLSQRVTARFHLDALNRQEVSAYINHRVSVAGGRRRLFTESSIDRIFAISQGIPRVINLVCDRALLGAYVEEQAQVNPTIVNKAAVEVLGQSRPSTARTWQRKAAFAGFSLLAATSVMLFVASIYDTKPRTSSVDALQIPSPVLNPITPPLPAPTRTLSRLDEITGHAASDSAVGELLSVWGHNESLDNQGNACDQIIQLGLACFSATGDLQDLIRLDRPAALNLGDNTLPNWVTLISLTKSLDTTTPKDIAQLQFGSTLYWVDQAALLANGAKPFILLWQTPAAYQQSLTLGDSGASVDWLVNRLTQIESGRATLEVGYIFDLNLEQRVKAFQRSSGIEPDGVAGARTWILLNNSTTDVPRLSTGVKY